MSLSYTRCNPCFAPIDTQNLKKMCLGNVVILIEIEMIIDNFNEVSQECFQP